VLGVARDAPTDEIERAFRLMARRIHPDHHGGDGAAEERMKQLNAIRATLTDPSARAAYDARLSGELAIRRAARVAARARSAPTPTPRGWVPKRGAAWLGRDRHDAAPPAAAVPTPAPGRAPEVERAEQVWRLIWTAVAVFAALGIVITAILARDLAGGP